MRRREFVPVVGGVASAWPLAGKAQQRAAVPVIGFLIAGYPDENKMITVPFVQSLKEAGYVEGQNIVVEYGWTEGQINRLPALAADLVGRRVAAIVAFGVIPAQAAKAATTTIPIIFYTGTDPVLSGLVASLNRPGGNLTGSALLSTDLLPKRLQLLRELIPDAAVFGALTANITEDLQSAARTMGVELVHLQAETDSQLEIAFATFAQRRVRGVLVGNGPFINRRMGQLASLAAHHSLPAIFPYREFALDGGLMSYGSSFGYAARQIGIYTARILKGAKPADLPVEQATHIELTLNRKTANALGIEFPTALLVRAEEVIE
jgi:putative ABC transport system substrate-binding protein